MYYSTTMGISRKTNRVLHFISLCLILFLIRTWYLGVLQHDYHVEQSKKPQQRVVIEKADRATIQDRFGIPLAINKIQYNASVCYAHIRQIPSVIWKKTDDGKRVRVAARIEYIAELSQLLGRELGLDPTRIEDIIHGRAALLPHTPYIIKEDISEEQYYRLRMLEKDWLGLQAERVSRRHYPWGKVACDVIGYLGSMDSMKYLRIAHELNTLEDYLLARERGENPFLPEGFSSPDEAYRRCIELQEKAYTMNDLVGKSGVEAFYEEALRGYFGKHIYEIDRKGSRLQELPGSRPSLPGKKLTLTISAELQDFAEKLLASIEGPKLENNKGGQLDEAWMRGGAVVAMIPSTGELVALASYPRFDPNDFIPTRDPDLKKEKEFAVRKWLESEGYLGAIWEGKRPVEREFFSFTRGRYIEEKFLLTWEKYLRAILPQQGPLSTTMDRIQDLKTAVHIQAHGIHHPFLKDIGLEEDKLLVLDLCHLVTPKEHFSEELIAAVGGWDLTEHYLNQQRAVQIQDRIKEELQELYYDYDFLDWRNAHFKDYLRRKRTEEKAQKKYARPYTDYLDRCERQLFKAFWDTYKSIFLYIALTGQSPVPLDNQPHLQPYIADLKDFHRTKLTNDSVSIPLQQKLRTLAPSLGVAYLKTLRSFEELTQPLQGKYPRLRSYGGKQLEKHLAAAFYPLYGYGFSRSQAYRQTSAQGSVFKLVTAYQALMERYQQHQDLNPLTLIDDLKGSRLSTSGKQILGYHLDGTPIYRNYKGGRLPRSSHAGMGRLDLIGALEQSSNVYFSIIASEHMQDPLNLSKAAAAFGLGERTGVDLPGEARGNIPDDLDRNRTGLYSFAIGQHTLLVSPLQTAVMIGTLANQGQVVRPHVLRRMEGPERVMEYSFIAEGSSLLSHGIPTVTRDLNENIVYCSPNEIRRNIPMPSEVFQYIAEGMQRVMTGSRGSARPGIMRNFYDHPEALHDFLEIHQDILGKTGTAQERYKQTLSREASAVMKDHVWFAAIAYPKNHLLLRRAPEAPELVVVVYLRFRQAGREGGTIAAQIIKKWRELKARGSL